MGAGFIVPKKSVLVVTRWTAQGLIDYAWATAGRQEARWRPNQLDYRPAGVLLLPAKERLFRRPRDHRRPGADRLRDRRSYRYRAVPGLEASRTRSLSYGGPSPCFRVTHPDGIDPGPPEYLQIQEFEAAILAARVLRRPRRLKATACVSYVPTVARSRRPRAGCSCRTSAVSASSRLATCNGSSLRAVGRTFRTEPVSPD